MVNFDTVDKLTGVAGFHEHVERRSTSFRPREEFDRWEVEAMESESWRFDSLHDAFSALKISDFASALGSTAKSEGLNAYWWCGCFHSATSATTVIHTEDLEVVAKSRSPIYLDTYYSPPPSQEPPGSAHEDPGDSREEPPNHRYRFRISCSRSYAGGDHWGSYFDDFGKGLESVLDELTKSDLEVGVAGHMKKTIECEHVQYAFDGGPMITAAQADAVVALDFGLVINWRVA